MLHVCSLAALPETVRATGASHILTVMANVDQVQRPASVLEANHLKVSMDDITEQMDGFVAPADHHIERVLNFVVPLWFCPRTHLPQRHNDTTQIQGEMQPDPSSSRKLWRG